MSSRHASPVDRLAQWDSMRAAPVAALDSAMGHKPPMEVALPKGVRIEVAADERRAYVFSRPAARDWLVLALAVAASALAAPLLLALREGQSVGTVVPAALAGLVAAALWATFALLDRTQVEVFDGVLHIRGRGGLRRYDLRDPKQRVHPFGTPDSSSWAVGFTDAQGAVTYLTPRQVSPTAFTAVLRQFRAPSGVRVAG